MKKFAFAIASVVVMTAMASCEKEYTCVCTYPNATVGTTETTFKTKKKSDAESSCSSLNTNAQATGGACALK